MKNCGSDVKEIAAMKYNKEDYIGKYIQLYPSDTYKKYGDDVIFISHSKSFCYKIIR